MSRRNVELFSEESIKEIIAQGRSSTGSKSVPADTISFSTQREWAKAITESFIGRNRKSLEIATRALEVYPTDERFLLLAAFAAVLEEKPDISLRYLKRLTKWCFAGESAWACEAIALAQSGQWPIAKNLVEKYDLSRIPSYFLFPPGISAQWGQGWLRCIRQWKPQTAERKKTKKPSGKLSSKRIRASLDTAAARPAASAEAPSVNLEPLPSFAPCVSISYTMPDFKQYAIFNRTESDSVEDFLLRNDFSRMSLLKGFDELLCIPNLHGVDHYWYQVETVRKVLKQFRGRAMLSDEVGLGKTIEAGMVLKEYLLRGMAERVLILTPASLVGQWHEEMTTKFDIEFITSHDPLLRRDPSAFWSGTRIIASIAAARLNKNLDLLIREPFDLVIVDEAHHLKSRTSRNWKLVDALKKRFLLLLSATPVENNLVELYNLLTLLKPGLFKTEKEFRSSYMKPHQPRVPVNRERLQDLMRDVMIRNTRALVDVHLPPRQTLTFRVDPLHEEHTCYQELSRLIRNMRQEGTTRHRLALHHLLQAAGSSPSAASAALDRFLKNELSDEWHRLRDRYAEALTSSKIQTLFQLLERNPTEKKMVFVRFMETLNLLDRLLRENGVPFARFDGQMSGPQKDRAIELFRKDAVILLCTESGGEGQNVQFCNTLINFDLHWNPQVIEQRIGRVHRIGQEREVFIFNLAAKDTIEDKVLTILDEKINMFELVVGEIQSILGEMEENRDFTELVFSAWVEETEAHREQAFENLGNMLMRARQQYDRMKAYDDELFGEEFEVV